MVLAQGAIDQGLQVQKAFHILYRDFTQLLTNETSARLNETMPFIPNKYDVAHYKEGSYTNSTYTNSSNLLLNIEVDQRPGATMVNLTIEEVLNNCTTSLRPNFTGLTPTIAQIDSSTTSDGINPTYLASSIDSSIMTTTSTPLPSAPGDPRESVDNSGTMSQGSVSLFIILLRNVFGAK